MRGISFLVSPIRDHAFFEKTQLERLLGHNLLQLSRLTTQILDLAARGRSRRIAGKPPLAGLQELLGPTVVKALGNPLAPAQFRNAVLAPQAVQYDADLLLGRILFPRRPADVFHDPLGRYLGCLGFLSHLRFSMELRRARNPPLLKPPVLSHEC